MNAKITSRPGHTLLHCLNPLVPLVLACAVAVLSTQRAVGSGDIDSCMLGVGWLGAAVSPVEQPPAWPRRYGEGSKRDCRNEAIRWPKYERWLAQACGTERTGLQL